MHKDITNWNLTNARINGKIDLRDSILRIDFLKGAQFGDAETNERTLFIDEIGMDVTLSVEKITTNGMTSFVLK